MDIEALQADLFALKNLYGILMRNQDDELYEHLDANSKLFLKNLLDTAAERLIESRSKMIDDKPSAFAWPCSGERGKVGQASRLRSAPWYSAEISPVHDKNNVLQGTTTFKNAIKLNAEMIAADLSQPSTSGNGSQSRRKRCKACQRRNMRGLMTAEQMIYRSENNHLSCEDFNKQDLPQNFGATNKTTEAFDSQATSESEGGMLGKCRTCAYKYNLSDAESLACSVRAVVLEGPRKLARGQSVRADANDDISDDVLVRLKRIESLIRSIQVPTKIDNPPDVKHVGMKSFLEPNLSRQGTDNSPSKFSAQRKSDDNAKIDKVTGGLSQKNIGLVQERRFNQIPGWRLRAALKRMESLSSARRNDSIASQTPEHVQGLRFTVSQLGVDEGHTLTSRKQSVRDAATSRSPTPAPSVGSTNFARSCRTLEAGTSDYNLARINVPRRRKAPHSSLHEKTSRHATPSDHTYSTSAGSRSNAKATSERNANLSRRNKDDSYHEQSEGETSWGSPVSSAWSSQPSSSYASSSKTFQSDSYDIGENQRSDPSDRRSSSQEFSSSPNRKRRQMVQDRDSEDYVASVSSSNQVTGRPQRARITRSFRSNHRAAKRSRTGRFRRLKNKLGMIFHHHHHHHHHHHDATDDDEAGHAKSLWRHFGKMFRHRTEKEPEKADVQESRRSRPVSKSVARKQQGGHFHALVDGLMRHIRHSRKSKLGKDAIKIPGNVRRGGRKAVNGISLWKKLQSQHGVNLANKGRTRLGRKAKRPPLSMANMRLRD